MDSQSVANGPSQGHPTPTAHVPSLMELTVDAPAKRSLIEEPQLWSNQIKKPKKVSKHVPASTPVSNSFEVLANQPTEASPTPTSAPAPNAKSPNTSPTKPKPDLPPPIIFDPTVYSTSRLAYSVRSLGITDFTVQTTRRQIKLFIKSQKNYKIVADTLKASHNTEAPVFFHTYAPAGSKPNQKYLIIGFDKDHPLEPIRDQLKHDDLIDVRRLTTVREGVRVDTANVLVTFKPTYNYSTHLSKISVIDNIVIRHKPFSANRAQPTCGKCQAIGHTKRYCWRPPRCVNCGDTHTGEQCSPEAPKKCANCGGDHPASYRQCPTRLRLLQKAKAGKSQAPTTTTTSRHPPPAPENVWGKHHTSQHLFPGSRGTSSQVPSPQPHPQPSTSTAPSWVTDLTHTLTTILNTLVATVQNLLTTLPQLLSK